MAMKMPRKTSAPSTPYISTRGWSSGGTRKYVKITAKTNRLSIERLHSIR